MPEKTQSSRRTGGPGAAHENRKEPEKSKPHGQLDREDTRSGAHHLRGETQTGQNKPYGSGKEFETDIERGHAESGATRGKQHAAPAPDRSISSAGDMAADTDLIHPRDRKQVR